MGRFKHDLNQNEMNKNNKKREGMVKKSDLVIGVFILILSLFHFLSSSDFTSGIRKANDELGRLEPPLQTLSLIKDEEMLREGIRRYIGEKGDEKGCRLVSQSAALVLVYFENLDPKKLACLSFSGRNPKLELNCDKIKRYFKERMSVEELYAIASCTPPSKLMLIHYNASEGLDKLKIEVKTKNINEWIKG